MKPDVTVDVLIEDPRWSRLDLDRIAETACASAIAQAGISGEFSISILATDDARIAGLNEQFRTKSGPTNVLSWPTEDLAADIPGQRPSPPRDPEIGDIALAFETCWKEAGEEDAKFHEHVTHLVLHGCLHLLGYDHVDDSDATVMEALEISALAKLGIGNPYS